MFLIFCVGLGGNASMRRSVSSLGGLNNLAPKDLASGHAFDNGCRCFETCKSICSDLRGQTVHCHCQVFIIIVYNILAFLPLPPTLMKL